MRAALEAKLVIRTDQDPSVCLSLSQWTGLEFLNSAFLKISHWSCHLPPVLHSTVYSGNCNVHYSPRLATLWTLIWLTANCLDWTFSHQGIFKLGQHFMNTTCFFANTLESTLKHLSRNDEKNEYIFLDRSQINSMKSFMFDCDDSIFSGLGAKCKIVKN